MSFAILPAFYINWQCTEPNAFSFFSTFSVYSLVIKAALKHSIYSLISE